MTPRPAPRASHRPSPLFCLPPSSFCLPPSAFDPPPSKRPAFTLVELLVVIGIIAVLISILLPSLNAARRQADRTKCLASMRQLHQAFQMYAVDFKGAWPESRFQKQGSGFVWEQRWFDFISKYALGTNRPLNPDGNAYLTAPPPPTYYWIGCDDVRYGNNVIWGCPSWKRMTSVNNVFGNATQHPGIMMNFFPFAPNDLASPSTSPGPIVVDRSKFAYQNLAGAAANWQSNTAAIHGSFFKASQWTRPAERCLLFDSVHPAFTVSYAAPNNNPDYCTKWPFQPENPSGVPFPAEPDGATFTLDFNRHGVKPRANDPNQPSMNCLYCDGHAAFVSCRECYRAIRFN